ncbi:MAG: cell division protein ZipA [Aestuariibacter sp.]
MEDLRLAIIVLGVFAIFGVLVHGIWTIRKNNKQDKADTESDPVRGHAGQHYGSDSEEHYIKISIDDPLLDDVPSRNEGTADSNGADVPEVDPLLGDKPLYDQSDLQPEPAQPDTLKRQSGRVEEVSSHSPATSQSDTLTPQEQSPVPETTAHRFDEDDIGEVRLVGRQEPASVKATIKESTPEPESEPLPEPPSSLLKKDQEPEMKIDTSIDIDDKPVKRATPEPKVTTETKKVGGKKGGIAERARKMVGRSDTAKKAEKDQIRLDLDDKVDIDAEQSSQKEPEAADQEVLIISIRAPEGKAIPGAALLPALLTLGFKFGEHNMFHRHANSNGKGPKLFSLANMFNPGTFDIDNMEKFSTAGLSLFMILPIEADPHQVFNMMHNAARKLADEFDLQILDGRRSALTKQSLQQYVEKIREFERRRMIKRA